MNSVSIHVGIHRVRKTIIWMVQRLPFGSLFVFRCYRFILKAIGTQSCTTYFGARMSCDPSDFIQSTILTFGVWEPEVSSVITNRLAEGGVFVDIGANVGYHTLLAAKLADKIVSIEANPIAFDLLSKNVAQNAINNIRMVNKAVSDKAGLLTLYDPFPGSDQGSVTTIEARGGAKLATIECAPLDEILTPDELKQITLIKIDVEGGEIPILRRLLDRISLYPDRFCIVVEASPHEEATAWNALFERMTSLSFTAFSISNEYTAEWYLNWRRATEPSPLDKMPNVQTDILFARV
jgi:FkbM family methyltransferase